MDKSEILKLYSDNRDSFVQIIKAKYKEFYDDINLKNNGKSFSEKLYRWIYDDELTGKCILCKNNTRFYSFSIGFRKYCSKKCANVSSAPRRSGSKPKNLIYWEEKECELCKKKFWALKFRNQIYCSGKCSSQATAKDESRLNKIRKTKMEKYGCETYVNPEKAKQTYIEKYGVSNPGQNNIIKDKIRLSFLKNYLNKLKTSDRLKKLVEPLFNESDFISTFRTNLYPFKCNKCGNVFNDHLDDGHLPRCLLCFPIIAGKSDEEVKIANYIKELFSTDILVENNNVSILGGKEIDIFIPSKNIGIEYDGLYWHSEVKGNKPSSRRRWRTNCIIFFIYLIQYFTNTFADEIFQKLPSYMCHIIDLSLITL